MTKRGTFAAYLFAAIAVVGLSLVTAALLAELERWGKSSAQSALTPHRDDMDVSPQRARLMLAIERYVSNTEPVPTRDELAHRFALFKQDITNISSEAVESPSTPDEGNANTLHERLNEGLKRLSGSLSKLTPGDAKEYRFIEATMRAIERETNSFTDTVAQRHQRDVQNRVLLHGTFQQHVRYGYVTLLAGVVLLALLFAWQVRRQARTEAALLTANAELRGLVEESQTLTEQLSYRAAHDEQTGLYNRKAFEQILTSLLSTVHRKPSHGLMFLDLDQFKVVNDTLGHAAGDELLVQASTLLMQNVRDGDVFARFGGDEFVVLLPNCSRSRVLDVANRVRSAFEQFRFNKSDKSFNANVSIGVVHIDAADASADELIARADTACIVAKEGGGNRIHLYKDDDGSIIRQREDMDWSTRIDCALLEGRFCLYRQSIVPLVKGPSGRRISELLVRMIAPDGTLINPGSFLGAAERYRLSPSIDRQVINMAFDWVASNPEQIDALEFVSINLSGHSIGDPTTLAYIESAFKTTRIDPSQICFEITETVAMGTAAKPFLNELRAMGCKLALDDFGSGLSSFAYLKDLPVEYLKIDGMFVKDIHVNSIHRELVRCINDIGHVMGKQTIAEFVEDAAVLSHLTAMGVDYAQGFYVGKPVPLLETTSPAASYRTEVHDIERVA